MATNPAGLEICVVLGRVVCSFEDQIWRIEVGGITDWHRFGKFTVLSITRGCATILHRYSGVEEFIHLIEGEFAWLSAGHLPVGKVKRNADDWEALVAREACHVLMQLDDEVVGAALAELHFDRERPRIRLEQMPKLSGMTAWMSFESCPGSKFAVKVHVQRRSPEAVINGGWRGEDAVYDAARAFDDPDHVAVVYNPDGTPREVFWRGRKIAD